MFRVPALAGTGAERAAVPVYEGIDVPVSSRQPAGYLPDGFYNAFEDVIAPPRPAGPGDSNYEMAFTIHHEDDDASSEWDAGSAPRPDEIEAEAPSSDEIAALTAPEPAGATWHHRFIQDWGRVIIFCALGLIAAAALTIGYLAWRIAASAQNLETAAPILIAGFACAAGMLIVAVPLLLIAASMTDLVRDLRRRDGR